HEPAAVLEAPSEREVPPSNAGTELELLRGENSALQAKVDDLEQLLGMASQEGEDRWGERQREYESLLEEKSEVIRSLHQKLAELRERASGAQPKVEEESTEPVPERQELLKLKRELDEQRRQIGEDEESMMAQMRQMEM